MPETAEQYRNRMYSHIHGRDPLALLAAAPKKLEGLTKGISAAKLRQRPAPGKWSICEIVAHLGDTELSVGIASARSWGLRVRRSKRLTRTNGQTLCNIKSETFASPSTSSVPSAMRIFRC